MSGDENKLWIDDNEMRNVAEFCHRRKLDFNNYAVKVLVRDALRKRKIAGGGGHSPPNAGTGFFASAAERSSVSKTCHQEGLDFSDPQVKADVQAAYRARQEAKAEGKTGIEWGVSGASEGAKDEKPGQTTLDGGVTTTKPKRHRSPVHIGGTPVPLKMRDSGANYWRSHGEQIRTFGYCKRHGLDYNDLAVRDHIRDQIREKDDRKAKQLLVELPEDRSKVVAQAHAGSPAKVAQLVKEASKTKATVQTNLVLGGVKLPAPTRYNSRKGTRVDPKYGEVNWYIDAMGMKQQLPKFDNDIEWIEFFLGESMLVPKRQDTLERLQRMGVLGKLRPIQRAVSRFMDMEKRAKIEIWRGAGKSDLFIGKFLRRICDNPNECLFVQSETEGKTISRIRVMKKELQSNQRLIQFYGYLPADNTLQEQKVKHLGKEYRGKWSEAVLELKRDFTGIEPTVMGISWQSGKGVGYHFTGGVLDDPWSVSNQRTKGDKERFMEWYKEFVGSLEDVEFVWIICTKKGQDDIYADFDAEKSFATFRQPLVLEWPKNVEFIESNGAITGVKIHDFDPKIQYVADDCFGVFTIDWCCMTRKTQGAAYFEREYQNNPRRLEGTLFNWEHVRFCDPNSLDPFARMPYEHPEFFNGMDLRFEGGVLAYDPAFGLNKSSSLNALVAMAVYQNRVYLLRAWAGNWKKPERNEALLDAKRRYPTYKLFCESVMAQYNIIKDLTDETGLMMYPYEPMHVGTKMYAHFQGYQDAGKCARIYDAFESVMTDRRLYIMPDCPFLTEFEDELKNFPDQLRKDMIDATAMGINILRASRMNKEVLSSGEASLSLRRNGMSRHTFHIT